MAMSKKDFIALADAIKDHNAAKLRAFGVNAGRMSFSTEELETLADFCKQQHSTFKRDHWLGYIAGENGKNGGAIK
jgi:hypothetical protein